MSIVNRNTVYLVRWLIFVPICVLLFFCLPLQAQESPVQNATNYGRQDGLISNNVLSVVFVEQDNSLWFGTDSGVSRFDGIWHSFSSMAGADVTQAFPAGEVGVLTIDERGRCVDDASMVERASGTVWAATDRGNVACWEDESKLWQTVLQLGDNSNEVPIYDLYFDDIALWVGTEMGLLRYNFATQEPLALASTCDEPTAVRATEANPIAVYAIEKQNETIWLGSNKGLLNLQSDDCWLLQETKFGTLDNPTITDLVAGTDNVDGIEKPVLWMGTGSVIKRFDPDPSVALDLRWRELSPLDGSIDAIVAGSADDLWIATNGVGAINYEPYTDTAIGYNSGVAERRLNNQVRDIAVDSDGSFWFVTPSGVTRYRQRNLWTNYNFNEQWLEGYDLDDDPWQDFDFQALQANLNDIRDLYLTQNGDIWIATGGGIRVEQMPIEERQELLYIGDGSHINQQGQFSESGQNINDFARLPENNTVALVEDTNGTIWAGFFSDGLQAYINESWPKIAWVDELPQLIMSDLLAEEQRIWISGFPPTADRTGLVYVDITTPPIDGVPTLVDAFIGYSVHQLTLDNNGNLWLAAERFFGDDEYEISVWQQIQNDGNSLGWETKFVQVVTMGVPPTISIAPDSMTEAGMWLAVSNLGLFLWQNDSWQEPAGREYLPTTDLRTIFADHEMQDIWIGSGSGVTRYDGHTWETYFREDRLTNTPVTTISKIAERQFLFGTDGFDGGLSLYTPTDVTPPWVRIKALAASSDIRFMDGNGNTVDAETYADALTVKKDVAVSLNTDASFPLILDFGDLQTPKEQLQVYYRTRPMTETGQIKACMEGVGWERYQGPTSLAADELVDRDAIEFCARDRAFEYSAVQRLPIQVKQFGFVLPGFGPVEWPIALLLLALSTVALLAFSYVGADRFRRRRRSIEAVSRGYNPYVSGEPIRDEYMFFGRHDLLQRIVDTLHNNSIMIHGERRIGKTTMLFQLASTLDEVDDPEYWFAPVYIDLEGTVQELFFHHLMEEIINKLLTYDDTTHVLLPELDKLVYHDTPTEGYTDRRFTRDLRTVIQALLTYGEKVYPNRKLRMILLMDEMDVLSQYDHLTQQQLRRIFMRDFAKNLGAVVAGIQISHEWDRVESPWYNLFNEIEIEPFSRKECITLLTEPVKEYYTYEPAAVEMILEQSEGRPFRIQQYALESVANMLADNRRIINMADVKVAHDNIQNSTSIIENDAGLTLNPEQMN